MKNIIQKPKSPIHWIGGKYRLAPKIAPLFPPHDIYVEPFGGGAHVFFSKEPSMLEIYNDINDDLVNFFEIARTHPRKLINQLNLIPYARSIHRRFFNSHPTDKFERALRFFVLNRMGFAGNMSSWGYGLTTAKTTHGFRSATMQINNLVKRFQYVQVECQDFRKVIELYDCSDAFFYCDPPYVGVEKYYNFPFSEKDHLDLAAQLNHLKGKAAVSYYPHPLVDQLYQDWFRMEFHNFKSTQKARKDTRGGERRTKDRTVELLLMNYDPPKP